MDRAGLADGRGLVVIGAFLHDVLTRIKAEPQRFPKIDLTYSRERPVTDPMCVGLPDNGLRLRFDGPEQRLRLIEVLDFTKNHITFKDRDLVRPQANGASAPGSPVPGGESAAGPTFRHIYHRLLGPTYGGEFLPAPKGKKMGIYVLSYPGVAFNFSLPDSDYSPDKDVVTLLSAAPSQVATSMAIFSGNSWGEARPTIWTEVLPSIKVTSLLPRSKDVCPDEVSLVSLRGGGKIDLFRKWTSTSFMIRLGETTPQDLVRELGPPNAIYRKNDQKMVIHKMRMTSNTQSRPSAGSMARPEDLTDTDHSSMNTGSDDSEDEDAVDDMSNSHYTECFYNYFHLGFDVLLSLPTTPSPAPPGPTEPEAPRIKAYAPNRLVATKLVLHGNIPGSYEFNRHRRCRWEIAYLAGESSGPVNSETPFRDIEDRMNDKWKGEQTRQELQQQRQRGMVLNRGWGDSPGSSCELLGGWEESGAKRAEASGDSTTTLYGFPGLVFEVLKNGYVNTVSVF